MAGKKFPEDGQQPLVTQQHFPGRLNELKAVVGEMHAEFFVPQPFPRIQFEGSLDAILVQIHKAFFPRSLSDIENTTITNGSQTIFIFIESVLMV